jgi:hypothetical protein
VDWRHVLGSRRLTAAVYLLALTARRVGRLATLDRAVPLPAVPVARQGHLAVVR